MGLPIYWSSTQNGPMFFYCPSMPLLPIFYQLESQNKLLQKKGGRDGCLYCDLFPQSFSAQICNHLKLGEGRIRGQIHISSWLASRGLPWPMRFFSARRCLPWRRRRRRRRRRGGWRRRWSRCCGSGRRRCSRGCWQWRSWCCSCRRRSRLPPRRSAEDGHKMLMTKKRPLLCLRDIEKLHWEQQQTLFKDLRRWKKKKRKEIKKK